jgi:hypothetical protein
MFDMIYLKFDHVGIATASEEGVAPIILFLGCRAFTARLKPRVSNRVKNLHIRIVRPVTTLWHFPCDVLRWILDIASLAMHAILEVDLKARCMAF